MHSGSKKQIDIARLKADVAAASIELLSAHCATDRVRLQYSPQDVVAYGERRALQRAVSSAEALHRFFSQIGARISQEDAANQQDANR
jgi:hypothetical protein